MSDDRERNVIRLELSRSHQIERVKSKPIRRKRNPVPYQPTHPSLIKFADKEYRDGYLQTTVRAGIAFQIQGLREKEGLSQVEFAEKTGKKQSTISRLENINYGKVSVQTLLDISCALGVALIVKFVSYPDFFAATNDMSPDALKPSNIFESIQETEQIKSAPRFI